MSCLRYAFVVDRGHNLRVHTGQRGSVRDYIDHKSDRRGAAFYMLFQTNQGGTETRHKKTFTEDPFAFSA